MRAFRGSSAITRYYPGATGFNGPSSEINALQVSRLNSYYSAAGRRCPHPPPREGSARIRGLSRLSPLAGSSGAINPGFCRRRDTSLHGGDCGPGTKAGNESERSGDGSKRDASSCPLTAVGSCLSLSRTHTHQRRYFTRRGLKILI